MVGLAVLAAFGFAHIGLAPRAALAPVSRPALSVAAINPLEGACVDRITASGLVLPRETITIIDEVGGAPIETILVQVGDAVQRGQVLARIKTDDLSLDVEDKRAAVDEAQANADFAKMSAARIHTLVGAGVVSTQDILQADMQDKVSRARLAMAQARLRRAELRQVYAVVKAPADGVVAARLAEVGSAPAVGAELFKLIQGERLEWHAEVPGAALGRIRPGQHVVMIGGSFADEGTVRRVSPVVDAATGAGLAFVDLQSTAGLHAGSFLEGRIDVALAHALTLPRTAVFLRDGFTYAMKMAGNDRVSQVKLGVEPCEDGLVKVVSGLTGADRVVLSGGEFLDDGDTVRVVPPPPSAGSGTPDRRQQP